MGSAFELEGVLGCCGLRLDWGHCQKGVGESLIRTRHQRRARCVSRGPAARFPRAPRTRSCDSRARFSRPSRRDGILTPSGFGAGQRRLARAASSLGRGHASPTSDGASFARARGRGLPTLSTSRHGRLTEHHFLRVVPRETHSNRSPRRQEKQGEQALPHVGDPLVVVPRARGVRVGVPRKP